MRFVLALVAFVVAAGMIALGIAQRTVLLPPPRAVVSTHVAKDVRYVVVPGSALRSHPGQQRIHVEGSGPVFAAYGRASDVTAWLSGERYQRVGIAGAAAATASTVLATAPPFATPLLVGGGLLAVVGLLLYMWALVHMKRKRGPRRKSPPRTPNPPAP